MKSKLQKNAILTAHICSYCLVCKCSLDNPEETSDHMQEDAHIKKLLTHPYLEKYGDNRIRKINKGYFCEFCGILLGTAPKVSLHIQERRHYEIKGISLLRRTRGLSGVTAFDDVLISERAFHSFTEDTCAICNEEFENENIHKTESAHLLKLMQSKVEFAPGNGIYRKTDETSFQCFTCNSVFALSTLNEHFFDSEHKELYAKCQEEMKKYLEQNKTTNDADKSRKADVKEIENDDTIVDKNHNIITETVIKQNSKSIDPEELELKTGVNKLVSRDEATVITIANGTISEDEAAVSTSTNGPVSEDKVTSITTLNKTISKDGATVKSDANEPVSVDEATFINSANETVSEYEAAVITSANGPVSEDTTTLNKTISEDGATVTSDAYEPVSVDEATFINSANETVSEYEAAVITSANGPVSEDTTTLNKTISEDGATVTSDAYEPVYVDEATFINSANETVSDYEAAVITSANGTVSEETTTLNKTISEDGATVTIDANEPVSVDEATFINSVNEPVSEYEAAVITSANGPVSEDKLTAITSANETISEDEDTFIKTANELVSENEVIVTPHANEPDSDDGMVVIPHANEPDSDEEMIVIPRANEPDSDDEVMDVPNPKKSVSEDEATVYANGNNLTYNIGHTSAFCRICETKLPPTLSSMKEHVNGKRHKSILGTLKAAKSKPTVTKKPAEEFMRSVIHFENMFDHDIVINRKYCITCASYMTITSNGNRFRCQTCEVNMNKVDIGTHMNSLWHKRSMEKTYVITSLPDSEFVRQVRPDIYHCGFCNLVMASPEIHSHLEAREHNINKGLCEIRLQRHVRDLPNAVNYRRRTAEDIHMLRFLMFLRMLND